MNRLADVDTSFPLFFCSAAVSKICEICSAIGFLCSMVRRALGKIAIKCFSLIFRARAVEISGTAGGDGFAATLNFELGAVKDMAGNGNYAAALVLSEVPDVGKPTLINASVELTSGLVIMTPILCIR